MKYFKTCITMKWIFEHSDKSYRQTMLTDKNLRYIPKSVVHIEGEIVYLKEWYYKKYAGYYISKNELGVYEESFIEIDELCNS